MLAVFLSTHSFGDQGGSLFFSCAARLETHERDFSGVCGSVVEGSATRFKVPQLRRHIRFCKRGRAVHANSLSARRATNWGLTGEQRDVNLTNWGKQGRGIAFDKPFQLQILVTCKCCSALRGATPNEEGRFFDCCNRSAAFWRLGATPPSHPLPFWHG